MHLLNGNSDLFDRTEGFFYELKGEMPLIYNPDSFRLCGSEPNGLVRCAVNKHG